MENPEGMIDLGLNLWVKRAAVDSVKIYEDGRGAINLRCGKTLTIGPLKNYEWELLLDDIGGELQ